jgi:hypothetical protein
MLRGWKITRHAAALLVACLAAGPVYANCTSPTGNETDIKYNGDFHTYQYCNGTAWVAFGGGIGSGAFTFISTQTASASASLQFTNLPTSYNTLFLNCAGLLVSASGDYLQLVIGEGATPTWETTGHYTSVSAGGSMGPSSSGQFSASKTATDLINFNDGSSSTTVPQSIEAYIDNVSSSTIYTRM